LMFHDPATRVLLRTRLNPLTAKQVGAVARRPPRRPAHSRARPGSVSPHEHCPPERGQALDSNKSVRAKAGSFSASVA
jgi:hypothetical protein